MASVKIFVHNKSSDNQQFLIFNDKPSYSSSVGAAWINVWGRSPGTGAENGTAEFDISEEVFAVCGMGPKALAKDLVVSTSDYEDVKLGTDKGKATDVSLVMDKGGVVFDKKAIGVVEKKGSFGISSAGYNMSEYKNTFCGLGRRSPIPSIQEVVPVSVWQAKPNQKYLVTPKRVYYISTGDYVQGTIVEYADLGSHATIDFTGRDETIATVELDDNLAFSQVVYSFDK
ncbi:MAG: hypothetical protein Q9219_007139 [cf. Caloplaca sp. 3 TL-2023]